MSAFKAPMSNTNAKIQPSPNTENAISQMVPAVPVMLQLLAIKAPNNIPTPKDKTIRFVKIVNAIVMTGGNSDKNVPSKIIPLFVFDCKTFRTHSPL